MKRLFFIFLVSFLGCNATREMTLPAQEPELKNEQQATLATETVEVETKAVPEVKKPGFFTKAGRCIFGLAAGGLVGTAVNAFLRIDVKNPDGTTMKDLSLGFLPGWVAAIVGCVQFINGF